MKDRELALRWWNIKSTEEKIELAKQAKIKIESRPYHFLTGSEIEFIWRNQPITKNFNNKQHEK